MTAWADPRYEAFIRVNGPAMGFQSQALWRAFGEEFGVVRSLGAFTNFARRIQNGGHIVPASGQRIYTDEILHLKCKAALITSDWQLPFHDAEWAEFAFKVGKGFGCDLHVINGDFLDASAVSKYDPQTFNEGHPLEEEFQVAEEILFQSCKAMGSTVLDLGNHEWRIFRSLLKTQITSERMLRLFSDEDRVRITELSQIILNEDLPRYPGVRCTHPKSYSRIAARVGTALASKHQQHMVVGHDHQIGYARDVSSGFTVVHTGLMADPRRLAYANTADSTAPMMSAGFAILDGEVLYLFDKLNCDKEFWLWTLGRKRGAPTAKAVWTGAPSHGMGS